MTDAPPTAIVPVILAGGSGTRLWPLSRADYPKQFVLRDQGRSLFQNCALRLARGEPGLRFDAPVVVTKSDFRFIVTEQMAEVGIDPGAILIEPEGRNTAPAILAAVLHIAESNPEAMVLVAPSDHVIGDAEVFHRALKAGLAAAGAGQLITFGVRPTQAETAYGYLEVAPGTEGAGHPIPLLGFVEKPDRARAEEMLAGGNYLWNAGIFLGRAGDLVRAYRQHAPEVVDPVVAALAQSRADLGFLRLGPEGWSGAPEISIDYAVMEKASNLAVVPFDGQWTDLGGWDAVWREGAKDANGVQAQGPATALDCTDSLLRSEDAGMELVGIGLNNILAVATRDAVLIADRSRAQEVRRAVAALAEKGARQATAAPLAHRPWGWFESLAVGERFQVKRIHVHPGAALSLQSHHHRAEHWVVVAGTAQVTIDGTLQMVSENQSVYVPLGARHRLENPGKVPVVLVEVQTGSYFGEDDIIRHEDIYARGAGADS